MLTLEQLKAQAPSVFAEKPWNGVSDKYVFLPTSEVVNSLMEKGIQPMTVKQSRTRIEGKYGFTKHMIRFRPTAYQTRVVGGVYPEIVMTNAHDRGSSYILESGMYRLICSNGMVASAGVNESYRVRHMGTTIGEVLDATYRIIDNFPQIEDQVIRFQNMQLTQEQREKMAEMALGLRWDAGKAPFAAARLLSVRREADKGTDLWTTFNVIQENITQGQHFSRWNRVSNPGLRSTRGLASIDADLSVNRGLWKLAEELVSA